MLSLFARFATSSLLFVLTLPAVEVRPIEWSTRQL